jgi:4-diphosphocytidyl-2-C-methyl-D-erythritol kinase
VPAARLEKAPAKINLTLRVIARRPDGYHEIESLVAFAGVADALSFTPGRNLTLAMGGPTAAASGGIADNLVLKAADALAERVVGLRFGRFVLSKRLPVAAGLGGGSSDAAAALRLLARANRLASDDPRLMQAARATGADVPVCLDPRPRLMRGIGDILSGPLRLPPLPAVLANPAVALATKDVFAALRPAPGVSSAPMQGGLAPVRHYLSQSAQAWLAVRTGEGDGACGTAKSSRTTPTPDPSPRGLAELVAALAMDRNDLEQPAIALAPIIADVLAVLRKSEGCRLARMSGSGATCFGLFETARAATRAARELRTQHPTWWIRATMLAG